MTPRIKENGSALHIIIVVVTIVALLGALGFVFWQNFVTSPEVDNDTTTEVEAFQRTTEVPADWKKYENKEYKLSFSYPDAWTVTEDSKGNPDLYRYEIGMGSSLQNYDALVGISELSLDEAVERFTENGSIESSKILSQSRITFDGLDAYKIRYENGPQVWDQYFVHTNGYTYELPYIIESSNEEDRLILLDSFRFS